MNMSSHSLKIMSYLVRNVGVVVILTSLCCMYYVCTVLFFAILSLKHDLCMEFVLVYQGACKS